MAIETIVKGGYLGMWGVALLLIWVAALRLINHAHVALAARGWISPPARVMTPIRPWNDAALTLVALCSGAATLIAFLPVAHQALPLPGWVGLGPDAQIFRLIGGTVVLTYFLTQVSEHPRWKLAWATCWFAFAFVLAALG